MFHGYTAAGVSGIAASTPHAPVSISNDYDEYPVHVAKAVAVLRAG